MKENSPHGRTVHVSKIRVEIANSGIHPISTIPLSISGLYNPANYMIINPKFGAVESACQSDILTQRQGDTEKFEITPILSLPTQLTLLVK